MEQKDYRIVVETEKGGKQNYYIQKRMLFVFWVYYRNVYDMTMYRYRVKLESIEEARGAIKELITKRKANKDRKIVKREVLMYGKESS